MVLQDRMNRLFEDATQRRARGAADTSDEVERSEWTPAADVYETESGYLIAMDLPGIDRAALDVDIDDNRLVIRGNREISEANEKRQERPRGKFMRAFTVPASVEQSKIEAAYKDGVLQITLPRRPEQKAQRVEIKIS